MYTLFMIFQYIGIVVLFGELCYVFYQKPSRQQNCMLLLILALEINFVGYPFELGAKNLDQALQAVWNHIHLFFLSGIKLVHQSLQ